MLDFSASNPSLRRRRLLARGARTSSPPFTTSKRTCWAICHGTWSHIAARYCADHWGVEARLPTAVRGAGSATPHGPKQALRDTCFPLLPVRASGIRPVQMTRSTYSEANLYETLSRPKPSANNRRLHIHSRVWDAARTADSPEFVLAGATVSGSTGASIITFGEPGGEFGFDRTVTVGEVSLFGVC